MLEPKAAPAEKLFALVELKCSIYITFLSQFMHILADRGRFRGLPTDTCC